MTRRPRRSHVLVAIASAFVLVGCGGGDDAAGEPAISPAEAGADAADAEPAPSPDSTVDEVPAPSTVESSSERAVDEPTADAVVTTEPPSTVAADDAATRGTTPAPSTTEPPAEEEPVAEETVPDEPSAPPVSAAEIADLEAQLDEIDALLTDLELDLEQD